MGWQEIAWYTLTDDFDADLRVDEWHGTNASTNHFRAAASPQTVNISSTWSTTSAAWHH
jgi:hypothetical protein